ncbi:RsmB/NOP family class I SAM-dependent RNA methyltransferase [Maricaulis sp.]|uniref:RsmB/NOP family class I SAM-dependent RNA methyltransferase n=1 Tax=Maricaulis sp. TaxID=1486257 RepID=UPI0026150BDB|nr:RsmB/NOP family class I SAM-dependent RNA methyltransferase [Maricaulis sp.]
MTDDKDPRRFAVDAYIRITKDRRTLEPALETLRGFNALPPRDKAFARLLLATSFRRLGQTTKVLNTFLSRPLDGSTRSMQAILVTGATQLLWLDTPPHAAVSTAMKLAEDRQDAVKFKSVINAVLRRVAKEGKTIAVKLPPSENIPEWLRTRWRKTYGPGQLSRFAAAGLETPPLDFSLRDGSELEHWAKELDADTLPTGTLRRATVGQVAQLPGYKEGAWWAQDAAAALPVKLLEPEAGQTIVDLCAAPGGKTMQLAAAGADVIAVDSSEPRMKRLHENLERTGLTATVEIADARNYKREEEVDAVLLDAPCSATGTLRRHPESPWIKTDADIRRFAGVQRDLARAASKLLKPGGRMILCTCSLEPEEGEYLISDVLKRDKSLKTDKVRPEEVPGLEDAINERGHLRITPAMWRERGSLDGFFIARLRKSA